MKSKIYVRNLENALVKEKLRLRNYQMSLNKVNNISPSEVNITEEKVDNLKHSLEHYIENVKLNIKNLKIQMK